MSGFKYVPVKATNEMTIAASQVGYPLTHQNVLRIWKAMIAAAPTQPPPAESDTEAVRNASLDERAAFEDSERKRPGFSHHGGETITPYTGSNGEHEYLLPFVQQRWEGWQARASLKSQPAQPSDSNTEFSDTEMLDWLIDKEYAVRLIGGVYDLFDDSGEWLNVDRPTAREAIKAAMRDEREGK